MKLIVQIPCFNEEQTLPLVLTSIPKKIKGIDKIETLIVDDGSTDKTLEVARKYKVNHIVRFKQHKGLAAGFAAGLDMSLRQGADIIVNTDGDNQYPQADIPRLIQPILDGTYEIVVGDRQTDKIAEFSAIKKLLQKIGSRVVQLASGTDVNDAPSGFRAYSREAAMRLNIITDFSYAAETIIQAGRKQIAITHVLIQTNPKTRESRLFKHIGQHVLKTGKAIVRSYTMYQPFKIFLISGIAAFGIGLIPYLNFLYMTLTAGERIGGHIQSLIFGAVFIILGLMFMVLGLVADLLAINRKLLEEILYRLKVGEYGFK